MFYARRNPEGQIVSLHREMEGDAREFLAADHPDVVGFFGQGPSAASARMAFDRMDLDLIRVIEDLVNAMIGKGLIELADLPAEAQAKLLLRRGFRERLAQQRARAAGGRVEFIDALDDTKFGQLR